MSIRLSLELESEVDAQAFAKGGPNALRAIKATIEDGRFVLSGSLQHDYEQTAPEAFASGVRPMMKDDAACYILFRTATWALFTWAPDGSSDAELYVSSAPSLRSQIGDARIPNCFVWRSMAEVSLDDKVVTAPKLSFDATGQLTSDGTGTQAPPPPPHAAVGRRVMVVGLASKPHYNGLHGVVVAWDGDKRRAGVKLDNGEGGEGIMLKPEHIIPEPEAEE